MTQSLSHPAPLDDATMGELIEDATHVPLPRRRAIDLVRLPRQQHVITVPDESLSLVADYADYGSC